jgi:hypothetical protein
VEKPINPTTELDWLTEDALGKILWELRSSESGSPSLIFGLDFGLIPAAFGIVATTKAHGNHAKKIP